MDRREFRSSGVQEFRSSGVAGVQELQELQEFRSSGAPHGEGA